MLQTDLAQPLRFATIPGNAQLAIPHYAFTAQSRIMSRIAITTATAPRTKSVVFLSDHSPIAGRGCDYRFGDGLQHIKHLTPAQAISVA